MIVTGGLGFIGKHFIKSALDRGHEVLNYDLCTYAADLSLEHVKADICKLRNLPNHDVLINFAAESHVDRSIADSRSFVETNINGVRNLLDLKPRRFIHISTDEVYGPSLWNAFDENASLNPQNPYAATKAAADLLIQAYANTYKLDRWYEDAGNGLNYNIIRPTNNYGPGQYPEKLIPRTIERLKQGLKAQVHGDGTYTRMWLHVEDTVNAIWTVIEKGQPGIYNIAGEEKRNIDIILALCEKYQGDYEYVKNRPGQDVRYSVNDQKLRALGWKPEKQFSLECV